MATGNTIDIFMVQGAELPAAGYAQFDTRNNHSVLDFDAATAESGYFSSVMPRHYGGGGLTAYVHGAFSSAIGGSGVLELSFERIGHDTLDIDTDSFASPKSFHFPASATNGNVIISSGIGFSNGAEIDSVAVGEAYRLMIKRTAAHASDNAAGDFELLAIELKET